MLLKLFQIKIWRQNKIYQLDRKSLEYLFTCNFKSIDIPKRLTDTNANYIC